MATTSSSHWLSWRPRSRRSHLLDTCIAVWLLLTCAVSAAASDPYSSGYYGAMTPPNPIVVSGDTLELNCTMSDILEGKNASRLYFTQGNRTIPNKFATVVNGRTVRLQYPNVQRDVDDGHWFCYHPSVPSLLPVGQQAVIVGEPPVRPNITGCVVYNWENMTCTWEPKDQLPLTGLATNQTLYWTLQSADSWYHCPHPKLEVDYCFWKLYDDEDSLHLRSIYYLYVGAKNELGNTTSYQKSVNSGSIVKPNRVKNLRVSESGDTHVNLRWNPPSNDKDILYKVRYMSLRTESWHEVNVTSRKSSNLPLNSEWVYLTELTPYTAYNISVTCIPGSGEGFWSELTSLIHTTDISVPSAAPVIPPGGFSISSYNDDPDKRKVDILWQSIPEHSRNGEIVKYKLTYCPYGSELSEPTEFAAAHTRRHSLLLDRATTYWVTLEAATRVGYNTSLTLSPLLIPKEDKLPPTPSKLVSVALQDDFVFVNWTVVEAALGYTVYWCKGSSTFGTCDDEMQWTPIDDNSTSHNVTLGSGEDNKQFIFGVSAELLWEDGVSRSRREAEGALVASSGVLWSDCTYDINKPVSAPKSVKYDHQKAHSVSLRWDHQDCGETVYIDKYIIFHCKAADCPAEDNGEEGDGIVRLEVDSSRDAFTIEELEPTEYRVWMRSYSSYKEGLSPPTERETIAISQSGPTKAVIAVFSIIGLLVLFFIVFGFYQAYKMCQKKVKENMNVRIERPPEVNSNSGRMFDADRDDYIVEYANLVDQDQQLSDQNSFLKENEVNQQKELPHPNGDIKARPCSPSSAPSFPGMQQPGALTVTPPPGVSADYMSLDALEQLEPNQFLARVYLGDGSVEGRKLNGIASDNLSHNDMVPLQSPPTGYDGIVEDMNGGMRALPATPRDVSMKAGAAEQPLVIGGQQRSADGGKMTLPYSQKSNSGQQSAGSTIPSYSKCGLPDDGEVAQRAEEPNYQVVDGEEEPSEPPSSPAPATYTAPPVARPATTAGSCHPTGREEEGTAPATGAMDQAPSRNSNGRPQAPAAQPYTVLPVGEKTSSLPDSTSKGSLPSAGKNPSSLSAPGYSACMQDPASKGPLPLAGETTSTLPDPGDAAWTEDPASKGSLSTGGVASGGGGIGQGNSSVSPDCQMVPPLDCNSLPQSSTDGPNSVEQDVDSSPQVATPPLADGKNTSDYQQQIPTHPSVNNNYIPIPPEGGSTTAGMGTPQNGQFTTAQIPSGHVPYSPISDAMPSLNIKKNNNGYVTVNM